MDEHLGTLYRQIRLHIMGTVTADMEAVAVAATPLWSVPDVIAHIVGIVEDTKNDNMAGAPSDAWTAAQVERGRAKSLAELFQQWEQDAPAFEQFLDSQAGQARWRVVCDANSHFADIMTALGLEVSLSSDFLNWAGPKVMALFDEAVAEQGLAPIDVELSNFEILRSRFGRRTAEEASAYPWSHDPRDYLSTWFIFGPAPSSIGEVAAKN